VRFKAAKADINAVIELLAERWPKAFSIYEARRRPLKIGIRDDILAALDGALTPVELGRALRVYTSNRVYRSRLVAGTARFNLEGDPLGRSARSMRALPRPRRQGQSTHALPRPRGQSQKRSLLLACGRWHRE